MVAPEGNQFWKVRSSHGRKPTFDSDDKLWEASCEYFEWVESNPLWENKVAQFQGAPVDMPVAKMRAMTIQGLCLFLGISDETWANYKKKEGFIGICKDIERVIYTQKFVGASADLLNPSIIARELGLADKQDVSHKGTVNFNMGYNGKSDD